MSSQLLGIVLALTCLCACGPHLSSGLDSGAAEGGADLDAGRRPVLDASVMDAARTDGATERDAARPPDASDEGRSVICDACIERRCAAQRDTCTDPDCLAFVSCLDACGESWGACWLACFEAAPEGALNRGLAYATCRDSTCALACWTPGWPFPPPEGGCVDHRGLCDPLVPGFETCCAGADTCSDEVGYCCRPLEAACDATSDCCGTYDDVVCATGTCEARSCYELGQSCSGIHPCCDARATCQTTAPSDVDLCCVASGVAWDGSQSDCCSQDIRYVSGTRSCA